ncbi:LysR family transcriptional regulator [Aureimonas phyllosphaerae]|uniref:LysR family transcriptional regulator n=1 Tax=Aureimonas phyllosphaerae TaxID=1166078 RepID=UPI003A5BA11A
MPKPDLQELEAFASVARHRSFRLAADALGVSRSTLSHAVIALERKLGARLLNRTTRSVSATEAGDALLRRLIPLLRDLDETLDAVRSDAGNLAGTLRINCGLGAAAILLETTAKTFAELHPGVELDLVTDGRLIDIVDAGFDAGVRLRESVPQDMIAVPFGSDVRFLAVAAPGYIEAFGSPLVPDDLHRHRCIRHRLPSGKLYRWEFEKHGQELAMNVPGSLTLDDNRLMVAAAVGGLGIAFVAEYFALEDLRDGRLVRVLDDWCPAYPGFCLYYPGRRHVPSTLRAFIDVLKRQNTE